MALKKNTASIGIEYDSVSIRAARVRVVKGGNNPLFKIEKLVEEPGRYDKGEKLVEGMIKVKRQVIFSSNDQVVVSIFGKQLYAAQIPFRMLPKGEMKEALKFEIRKNISFNFRTANLEYQVVEERDKKNVILLVTAVSDMLLNNHLKIMDNAGIKPDIVDVLPCAIANTFWLHKLELEKGTAYVIIHFAPMVCTLVIDGLNVPFYTRTIHFPAKDICEESFKVLDKNKQMQVTNFQKEVRRSLSYYDSTYGIPRFADINLMGAYANSPIIETVLTEKPGLKVNYSHLTEIIDRDNGSGTDKGKFDLAVALALREE